MLRLNEDARSVLDVLKEGIAIIDTEGRLVFGNRAYCEFLNKEAGGDIGARRCTHPSIGRKRNGKRIVCACHTQCQQLL